MHHLCYLTNNVLLVLVEFVFFMFSNYMSSRFQFCVVMSATISALTMFYSSRLSFVLQVVHVHVRLPLQLFVGGSCSCSSSPPVVCRSTQVLFTLFVFFLRIVVSITHCVVFLFFFVLCTLCCQFPGDYPFMISVFSNVVLFMLFVFITFTVVQHDFYIR